MRKVREKIQIISSFQNHDLQELVEEHELRHGVPVSNSADLLLSDPPYNVRSSLRGINFHYDVTTIESTAKAVGHGKRVVRLRADSHLFCPSLQFGQ